MGRKGVKITVDTNVLVRAVVRDDEKQARAALAILREAETAAIPLPCLCELVWVLRQVYGVSRQKIAAAVGVLLASDNVAVDRPATDAGLAVFNAEGDFADGVIAHEGRWLGGEIFVSFDKKAVSLVAGRGQQARLLA